MKSVRLPMSTDLFSGDSQRKIEKSTKSRADCVCLDLEDGVSATSKVCLTSCVHLTHLTLLQFPCMSVVPTLTQLILMFIKLL